MPPSKKRKAFDWPVNEGEGCIVVEEENLLDAVANENEDDDADADADADANVNGGTNTKIKCRKCYRLARKGTPDLPILESESVVFVLVAVLGG